MAEKGWMGIPGLRPFGDRTVEEQLMGLGRALAEAVGKTVLDLGCAEGAIGLAFAKAGAKRVLGIELLDGHLAVARKLCRGYAMDFRQANLADWIQGNPEPERFDIVLALGIIHKLPDPNVILRWAARSASDLLCFRAPARVTREGDDYFVKAKHTSAVCNVPATMRKAGFSDEGTIQGARGEAVQYWRRRPALNPAAAWPFPPKR